MSLKILFAGESWMSHTIHVKGFDSFTTSKYEEGGKWLKEAFEAGGHEVVYLPAQDVSERFPFSMDELKNFDAIVLSDIGANTFLLSSETFSKSKVMPNRLSLIRDYVVQGGALLMIGGYLSFTGIDAKARYYDTPIEQCLPVNLLRYDDRVEKPEGYSPTAAVPDHPVLKGIYGEWPVLLGYNRLLPKENADVIMQAGADPFLVVSDFGEGRTAAFASDCSPHWGSLEFVNWEHYNIFWIQLIEWLAKK